MQRAVASVAAFERAGLSAEREAGDCRAVAEAHGARNLPETGARCSIEISLRDDVATLTLDTTGIGLHKRGYRPLVGEAQLRETLAARWCNLVFGGRARAGRSVLRDGHDSDRSGADRPQHRAGNAPSVCVRIVADVRC